MCENEPDILFNDLRRLKYSTVFLGIFQVAYFVSLNLQKINLIYKQKHINFDLTEISTESNQTINS